MSACLVRALIISLTFWLCFSNPIQGKHDASLDPNRIHWWRTRWSPLPIELSSINAEALGVSITLRWSPSTDIPSGIIEIEFPREFYTPGGNQILTSSISNIKSGQDYTTKFSTLVDNPASGVYGPIKVRTRYFTTGQIIDVNENFAVLAIAPKEKAENSNFLVSLESTPRVGDLKKELRVSFNLLQSIFKYDIVTIGVDTRWVLSDTVECSSYKDSGAVMYFKGVDEKDKSKIACSVDKIEEKQYIQVYGLGNDIDISDEGANSVELRFKYVSVPKAKYESYDWSLKISRFGTRRTYQSARYTQGPAVQTGSIISGSWKPTWNYIDRSAIPSGMSLYIDISIPTLNTIPVGGSMTIVLTDKVNPDKYYGNTANGCWVVSPKIKGTICIANKNTNTLTISGFQEEIKPRTIVVSTVIDFSSTSFGIKTVSTYGGYLVSPIDSGANIDTASISTSNININTILSAQEGYTNSQPDLEAGKQLTGQNLNLLYGFAISNNCSTSYKYRYFLPYTQTKGEDQFNKFYIFPQTINKSFYISNYYNYYWNSYNSASHHSLDKSSVIFTIQSDKSYIDFGNYGVNPCNYSFYSFLLGMFDSGEATTFPIVASNPSTRYSILLEISHPDYPSIKYYGSCLFNLVPSSLLSYEYLIYTNYQIVNFGYITFYLNYEYPSITSTSATYYLEIAFPSVIGGNMSMFEDYLGSGLKDGDSYPASCTNLGKECSPTIWFDGSYTYLKFKNPSILSGTISTISFTHGQYPNIEYYTPVYTRLYYISSNDSSDMKNISHQSFAYNRLYKSINNCDNRSIDVQANSDKIQLSGICSNYSKIILCIYGGYSFSESTKVLSYSTQGSPIEIVSNKKVYSIAGKWSVLYVETTESYYEIVLEGVSIPKYADKLGSILYFYQIPDENYYGHYSSYYYNTYTLVQSSGSLTKVKVMPTSVKARASTFTLTDITVSFTASRQIPSGGQISIQINNKWDTASVSTECKTTGLQPVSGKSLTCSISSSLFTISNLNSVKESTEISITIRKLIPPTYSATPIPLFNTITTYADSSLSYEIDKFDATKSTGDDITLTTNSDSVGSAVVNYLFNLPSNLNTDSTSIFMTVGLASSIPAGSIFLITFNNLEWLYPNGDIKNFCWVRGFKYQKCEKTPSGISITLAEDFYAGSNIDIYLENCIRIPSFNSAIENAIQFTVSYSSYTIISNSQGYSYNPTIIPKTISATVSLSVKTFGEASNYTFSIVSSKVISSGDEIWILFPGDYYFFIGDVSASSDNTVFTMKCEGNNAECVVDHRIVIIRGITTSKANEAVSVSLINVYNPNVGITGNIVIAHYDTVARVFKGIGMISGESINKTSPSRLVITKIDITDRTLENPADYEIWFEFSGTFDENTVIYVKFPQEFEINEGSSYSCTLNLSGDSATVLANTSCSYKYSSLFFQLTKSQSRSFSVSTLLSLKISSVTNDLKPLPRSEPISDWERDLTDSITFSKYELYSSRFTLYILSKSSNTIVSKSYYEMNPSYLGYYSAQPQAKITASASASVCEDLYIDGSLSIGDDLTYSWEVISDITNSALAQFNTSLKSGYSSSSLVIPASVLKPSVITVYLTVSNKSYSDSNSISVKVSEFELPVLEFITGNIATTSYSRDYTIRLSVKLPNCSSLPTDQKYEWSVSPTSSKFSSPNKSENTISKGSLLPGVYTITVKFSIPSIPNYTYTASMELTVQSSELVAIITGGNRKHNISKELILDGSSSYDPDGLATPLLYFWQCSYQNTPCQLSDRIEYDKSSFRIPPNNLQDSRVYTITLTVSSSSRQSNTSTDITATNEDLPDIYIHPPSAEFIHTVQNTLKVYIPEGIILTSMKWSCNINSVIFSESPDLATIYIKEFTLQGGKTHIFTFTAEYKEVKISSTVDVYVDAPPSPGEFTINPEAGTSLATLFSFLAQNWTDKENDLPLRYELYRVTEYGASRIGVLNGNREFNTVLPAGKSDDDYDVEFILRVYDSLGAYTEKTSKVKVQPSNDIYGEAVDYIENMMNDKNYEESGDIPSNLKSIADSLRSKKNLDMEKTQDIVSKSMDLLNNYYQTHDSSSEISLIYSAIASLTSLHTNVTLEVVDETVDIIYDILNQAPTTDNISLTNIINIMNNLQTSIIPSLSSSNFNLTSYRIHECIQLAGQSYLSTNLDSTYLHEHNTNNLYTQINRVSSEEFSSSMSISTSTTSIILPSLSNKIQDALLLSSSETIGYIVTQTNHKLFSDSSDESLVGYISLDLYVPGSNSNGEGTYPSRRINVQNLAESIKISLPLNYESDSDEFACVYLIEDTQKWSSGGCRFVEKVDNDRVICECNHLSLFSAIGNKERINVEEYNEIPTVEDDDIEANEEEDDEMSFSIVILIGALVFIQILLSISGMFIDSKQASKNFKLVKLSNFPPEAAKSSIQPRSDIDSNQAPLAEASNPDQRPANIQADPIPQDQPMEVLPLDLHQVMLDIVIERVRDESPDIKEPEPHEYILNQSLNISINPEKEVKKPQDNPQYKVISVQNLKNKDKSCLEWIVLKHECLGFFMRYDRECSKLLRVLVFFTGNYLGIFILGLLYNRNFDADNERESKSALDVLKEFDYIDALYILVANCVGILCFILRVMVTNIEKEEMNVSKVIGIISSWIIGMGSIAGSVLFSLEYHVIYIQRNVTIMWSYSAAIFFLIRVLIIDFIYYPINLLYTQFALRHWKMVETPHTARP